MTHVPARFPPLAEVHFLLSMMMSANVEGQLSTDRIFMGISVDVIPFCNPAEFQ